MQSRSRLTESELIALAERRKQSQHESPLERYVSRDALVQLSKQRKDLRGQIKALRITGGITTDEVSGRESELAALIETIKRNQRFWKAVTRIKTELGDRITALETRGSVVRQADHRFRLALQTYLKRFSEEDKEAIVQQARRELLAGADKSFLASVTVARKTRKAHQKMLSDNDAEESRLITEIRRNELKRTIRNEQRAQRKK